MTGRLVEVLRLTIHERGAMFALLDRHFSGVSRMHFDRDLSDKQWAVLVVTGDVLVGFSTIRAFETEFAGERVTVVYSGDTIVSPDGWGSANFPRAWIHAVYYLQQRLHNRRLLWMLLTSGFRTYRFLPVFWHEFYPRHDVPTPMAWQTLINDLASRQFGMQFDTSAGIVRFENPQRLRGVLADIPAGRLTDPHVAFFLHKNPGHAMGDELVCIADLSPTNLTPAGRRVTYGAAR